MPLKLVNGNTKPAEYERIESPCEESETATYFPRDVWLEITEALILHSKVCAGLEFIMVQLLTQKGGEPIRAVLQYVRCRQYRVLSRQLTQILKDGRCASKCIKTERKLVRIWGSKKPSDD